MKRIFFTVLFASLFYAVKAQEAGNFLYNQGGPQLIPYYHPAGVNLNINMASRYEYSDMLTLKADVMMNVKPSSYIMIFSITQVDSTAQIADSIIDYRINKFKSLLYTYNITDDDIHTDFISSVPTYKMEITEKRHSITGNEIAEGFELKKNLHIRVRNTTLGNEIVAAAAMAEIYEIVKVDYIVDNMELVYHQLRQKAIEIIEMKKLPYIKWGYTLKQQNMGETRGSVYPAERYARYTAYKSGTPAFYKNVSAKKTVEMNYADKNQTIYYEKVPFNQFDHVINADFPEACVQFYFSLQVNYKLVDEEAAKREKEDREHELKRRAIELENLKNPKQQKTAAK